MALGKLITNKTNISYLSGFTGSSGFMLLIGKKSFLFTDFRYIERAKNTLKTGVEIIDTTKLWKNKEELKKNWQKLLKKEKIDQLGIEEKSLTVDRFKFFKKISGKVKFTNISGETEKIREIKTEEEIKNIKKSQEINEKVFKEIKKSIDEFIKGKTKTPPTEIDLAWKIKELGNKYGANDISFDPIVAFGPHSAIPHHEPDNTKLKKGDIILIDMGMKYRGYCSDMSRTFFTANPTKKQLEIYNLVLKAQEEALKKIKPSITGNAADALSRDIIEKAGYGEYYGHAGGHGLGLDIHESPALSEGYNEKINPGTVITIEPGIYLPGEFGVRIEDMLLIKEKNTENLTKVPKKPF